MAFEDLSALSRRDRVRLTLVHQHIDLVRRAVLGNNVIDNELP